LNGVVKNGSNVIFENRQYQRLVASCFTFNFFYLSSYFRIENVFFKI